MSEIKVMVVDDSALVRETLSQIINEAQGIELIATAANPLIAMKKMEQLKPDVMILDIEMPKMDGLTFLKQLMTTAPLPVIICSSKSESGSQNALTAMEYGAVEIIQKPKLGTKNFFLESKVLITDAIMAASQAKMKKAKPSNGGPGKENIPRSEKKLNADAVLPLTHLSQKIETTEKVVVVGASTGGTEALRIFLEMMPLNCPPIVIVQHMPEKFTSAFANRLNTICTIEVKEAEQNDSVLRGRALIAPGNRHTLLRRSGARYYVEVKDGPLVARHRPSVDVLFRSAARYGGSNIVGVIMTGMGDDGAKGMKELKENGAHNIAQDEASSVVFGMPKEAIKLGGVDDTLPLSKIAARVIEMSRR